MRNLKHGIFLAPFHDMDEDPTACMHYDLELIEWLDRLGFDEAWIGEHHSGGFETISSPELFIASAAERTRRLKFGTGVVSLPYHNPLMVANRIIQLDHMTRGRIMFGAGPGLLATDAMMLGIEPAVQRTRMVEALEVILRLFRGECVTAKTDWFTLKDARLHLLPYSTPHPEVAVASAVTPSGGMAAGKYDLSMLCVAATDPSGFDALSTNWKIACEEAAKHDRTMDPSRLRVVGPIHIAETREQARANVRAGFLKYITYMNNGHPRFPIPADEDPLDWFLNHGYGVVGTPDDAVAMIQRLYAKQGHFGTFLIQDIDWADRTASKRSYELYARFVIPQLNGANAARRVSYAWSGENRDEFSRKRNDAAAAMFAKHAAQKAPKNSDEEQTESADLTPVRKAW